MQALVLLVVFGLVFYVVWNYLARHKGAKARLGPVDTDTNTAPDPDRDTIRMSSPPSDVSRYGDLKMAPGANPGEPGAETKEKVLSDIHRDVEVAEELTPPRGRVILFRGRLGNPADADEVAFAADPAWKLETAEEWEGLKEIPPLPAHYDEDVTMVLIRNPRSLYVYWERAGYGDENLQTMLGADEYNRATPIVRVYDVTSGAFPGQAGGQSWTIEVADSDDHWFLNEGIEPGREYVVSYERRTRDGRCYLLSHSRPVRTPHDGPDANADIDVTRGLLYQQYVRQPEEQGSTHPGSQWR